MELFMVKTGFYRIVTNLESQRQAERQAERDAYLKKRARRKAERAVSVTGGGVGSSSS